MTESLAEGSKPQSAELLDLSDIKPRQHLQMKPVGAILLQNGDFFDFVENASQEVVVFLQAGHNANRGKQTYKSLSL
ncbi:hypothetical protein SUGI_1027300 [Cryptomeria japonica]|nr:hypothetical protein SUGI_1027300 [Cryptomeria japonica]